MQLSLHLFVTNSLNAQDRACSEGALPAMVSQSKESKAKAAAKATASEVANGSQATLGAMPGPGVSRPAARSHELALTVDVKKEFEDRTQIDFRLL